MVYEIALSKAWSELENLSKDRTLSVKFLADEYTVEIPEKRVLSLSCNIPAKDYLIILLLHYLVKKLKGLPSVVGEWIDFRQLEGGLGYYLTFKRRVLVPILRKYSTNPQALSQLIERFGAKRIQLADFAVVLNAFEGIPILVELWEADEEFKSEVNLLFDKSIKDIFCMEDIVVLSEFIVHNI